MPSLPTLVHDKKTRTNNEALIYYNLDVGRVKETKGHDGSAVQTVARTSCGGDATCPSGSFDASVLPIANRGAAIGSLPINSPAFSAIEGSQDPGAKGDIVDVVCLPDPNNDTLICFDQNFTGTPGLQERPIPKKFAQVDHYVRQRSENSLSLSDLYVSSWDGVQRIRGVRCTIIVKITPDGGATFSEIQYYSNVQLSGGSLATASDGNASIENSMEASFEFVAIFSAQPT